ncbi:Zn(II)2Cys6 transcription factor domain-containing protein [Aspergillus stella-maris]|uniref:Zn(II)2Cys6 transcription factor domain-containing protein n=1 Tax=Aspergillus stella-maris TaxID=1810926 RepID=UPI003CCE18DF
MPRRPHTKSRSGCQRCKEKHIKCDEARPACSACVRYNVPCIPKVPKTSSSRPSSSAPAPGTSAESSRIASPAQTHSPRRSSLTIWEFELLHNWTIQVSESFEVSPGFHNAWRDRAVKEALNHEWFLHMILVLSALHMALTKHPSFTETHRAFILQGCSDATTRFRQEAENPSDRNCHAIQAFPFFLTIYALALGQLDREVKSEAAILDEIIGIMVLIKGHRLVKDTTNPFIALQDDHWVQEGDFRGDQTDAQFDSDLTLALRQLQPWIEGSSDSLSVKAINTEAVRAFIRGLESHLHRNVRALAWPTEVESNYLDLLRQRNPTAIVILAYYAVVLGQSSSQWWCANWGVRLGSVIVAILPAEYREAVSWPLQMLNLRDGAVQVR